MAEYTPGSCIAVCGVTVAPAIEVPKKSEKKGKLPIGVLGFSGEPLNRDWKEGRLSNMLTHLGAGT